MTEPHFDRTIAAQVRSHNVTNDLPTMKDYTYVRAALAIARKHRADLQAWDDVAILLEQVNRPA